MRLIKKVCGRVCVGVWVRVCIHGCVWVHSQKILSLFFAVLFLFWRYSYRKEPLDKKHASKNTKHSLDKFFQLFFCLGGNLRLVGFEPRTNSVFHIHFSITF